MRSAKVRTRSEFCAQASASMASDGPSDNEGATLDEEVEHEMWRASVELAAHGEREPDVGDGARRAVRCGRDALQGDRSAPSQYGLALQGGGA